MFVVDVPISKTIDGEVRSRLDQHDDCTEAFRAVYMHRFRVEPSELVWKDDWPIEARFLFNDPDVARVFRFRHRSRERCTLPFAAG